MDNPTKFGTATSSPPQPLVGFSSDSSSPVFRGDGRRKEMLAAVHSGTAANSHQRMASCHMTSTQGMHVFDTGSVALDRAWLDACAASGPHVCRMT